MSNVLGSVVSTVISCVDVDGVVRRVDLNDALDRVDLDSALDRVDVNRLLDRVDIDRHLRRVDLDAVLDRVDIDRLVRRSNLGAIVARSSTGVFGHLVDGLRAQTAAANMAIQRLGRCACCFGRWELPPAPQSAGRGSGSVRKDEEDGEWSYPPGTAQLAVEIQGRYAGIFPRFLAWLCDKALTVTLFTLFLLLMEVVVNLVARSKDFTVRDWYFIPVCYAVWEVVYTAGSLAVVGRTVGMALFGLLVVGTDGSRIGPIRAILRTCFSLFSAVLVVGVIIGWVRRDGRQLHDLLLCTGVVFSWDARLARMREEAMNDEERNL